MIHTHINLSLPSSFYSFVLLHLFCNPSNRWSFVLQDLRSNLRFCAFAIFATFITFATFVTLYFFAFLACDSSSHISNEERLTFFCHIGTYFRFASFRHFPRSFRHQYVSHFGDLVRLINGILTNLPSFNQKCGSDCGF